VVLETLVMQEILAQPVTLETQEPMEQAVQAAPLERLEIQELKARAVIQVQME
jgi:hypothetical protein